MANEVIDLTSSSPPPENSPTQATAPVFPNRATLNNGNVTEPARGSAAMNFAGLNDEFDLTGDFVEVVPSLPERAVDVNRRSAISAARYGTTLEPLADEIEFLSDDFDLTGDLSDPTLVESTGNKRRRISPSPVIGKAGTAAKGDVRPTFSSRRSSLGRRSPVSTSFGPRNQSRNGGRISAPALPSSSDPFASSPPANSTRAIPPTKSNCCASPDPFASSPRPSLKAVTKTFTQDNLIVNTSATRKGSPDPFASSPSPQTNQRARLSRRRAGPDIDIISCPTAPVIASKSQGQNWDPISSSAPENCSGIGYSRNKGTCHSMAIDIESDGSSDELPDIGTLARKPLKSRSPLRRSRSDIPSTGRARTSKSTNNYDREARAAAKQAEKERKKLERQAAKDAKAREKERATALAEVNKMRTDKKVSAREMIVDLPSLLGPKVQAETILEGLEIEHTTWESTNIIKWRRKVTSRFNEDVGHWEPIPQRIVVESHVAVILTAEEFVDLALSDDGISAHYSQTQEKFPGQQVIYLLEGLTPWMRKNRNIRNRQFASGVRTQEASSSSAAGRRRNAPAPEYISEDIIEDALLELQIQDALIHHTAVPLETAQWVAVFTQHISTIPYKKQRNQALSAGFCMESGQVRTGDDVNDTYIRMLQEIARVTAPIAYGVATEFGSVSELVKGLETGGPSRLEGLRKTVNKEGALSDRTIGQAVSKRMHKVFTGRDELSTDV
ncbi:hypothetical protein ACO1O0_006754 [Amphichorda felina]